MAKSKKYYIIYGVVGLAILFVAFVGFNYLKGFPLFSNNNSYYILYDRVDGLNVSNPVIINGYKIGKVSEIELLPKKDCALKVTIKVNKHYKFPKGTIARIESTDLLGSKGISIEYAEDKGEYISNGEELKGSIEQSLKDQVSIQMLPVKRKAEDLMLEMSNVMEIISEVFNETTRENLINSISKLTSTISHLDNAVNNVDSLIEAESPRVSGIIVNINEITGTLKNNKKELDNIMKNLSQFSDTLAILEIKSTVDKANLAIDNIDQIVAKINRGEGTLGDLVNNRKLLTDLETTVNSLNLLVEDIKSNPKKYIHLSLVDRGKTIYITDSTKTVIKNKKE